ncbi:MAG: SCP2 sterol-binding domain-containing protein [Anaerolineales bacterium]
MKKNLKEMLQDFVDLYHHHTQKGRNCVVDFDLQPDGGTWHVVFEGEEVPEVQQGPHAEARFTFVLSPDTLVRLYRGDLSPLTAAGREHISKPAPLDFRLGEAVELTPDVYREMILFMQRFFNRSSPECIFR